MTVCRDLLWIMIGARDRRKKASEESILNSFAYKKC